MRALAILLLAGCASSPERQRERALDDACLTRCIAVSHDLAVLARFKPPRACTCWSPASTVTGPGASWELELDPPDKAQPGNPATFACRS